MPNEGAVSMVDCPVVGFMSHGVSERLCEVFACLSNRRIIFSVKEVRRE